MTKEDNRLIAKYAMEEMDNLKKFATPEELARLDFKKLNAVSTKNCIYGQMTGYCYSNRAYELFSKCSSPVSFQGFSGEYLIQKNKMNNNLLGYSSLEYYIYHASKKTNKNIIDWLTGKCNAIFMPWGDMPVTD